MSELRPARRVEARTSLYEVRGVSHPLEFGGNCAIFVTVAYLAALLAIPQAAFAWGREGHQTIVIVAEHYMRPETAARMWGWRASFLGRAIHTTPQAWQKQFEAYLAKA